MWEDNSKVISVCNFHFLIMFWTSDLNLLMIYNNVLFNLRYSFLRIIHSIGPMSDVYFLHVLITFIRSCLMHQF